MADAYLFAAGSWPPYTNALSSPANLSLNSALIKTAATFMLPETITCTRAWFRYGARTGTPPTYKISIQGVDTAGKPDGTVLGGGSPLSATFTPPASTAWDATGQWITLDNSGSLTKGTPYAVVIEHSSGTVDASNCSSFTNRAQILGNVHFPSAWTGASGPPVVWSRQSLANPTYGVGSSTKAYGQLALTATETGNLNTTSTPDEAGLWFQIPAGWCDTFKVTGVWAVLRIGATTKNSILTLYDSDGTTVLQAVTLLADLYSVVDSARECRIFFDEATLSTLTAGSAYRLTLVPQETNTNARVPYISFTSNLEAESMGGGPAFAYTERTDAGAWTEDTAKRPLINLILADITEPAAGGGGLLINPGLSGGLR